MNLKPPFFISSHLVPALKIGEATLTLLCVEYCADGQDRAHFRLDTPEFICEDDKLKSSVNGFNNTVEIFDSFLSFLSACAESYPDGENADLFPPYVAAWAAEHMDDIDLARSAIEDEDGNPIADLITED